MHNPSRREVTRLVILAAAGFFASTTLAFDGLPLAIRGYDPVAYFTAGTPTPGLPEFELEWDEHRYRFSRAEHREIFKADPKAWLINDGKLYIFGAPEGPRLFQQSLADNIAKANHNRGLVENLQR
jgi:hypothetical protein